MLASTRGILCAGAATLSAGWAAVCDLKSRRIPNLLTACSLLAGMLLHLWLGGMAELGSSLVAALLIGAPFFLLYLAGGMGAGDVKLMAAVGCISGLAGLGLVVLATVLSGGCFGLGIAICRNRLRSTLRLTIALLPRPWRNQSSLAGTEETAETPLHMPFAIPIAFGCLVEFGLQIGRV